MDAALPTGPEGLTQAQAAQRLAGDGPNELPQARRRTVWHIALEVAREPMFQLLLAAGVIYFALGDVREAAMLLGFVLVIITITIVQEQRTERVLEALRDLSSPRALVIRDGQPRRVAGREVACGDLMVLGDGDRVAADGVLRRSHDLRVDESLLSGESVPVGKAAGAALAADSRPGGEGQAMVYAGTMVVGGQGLAQVTATGARSELGRIGQVLRSLDAEPTPLQRQTRQWVRLFSLLGLGVSAAATLLYGVMRGDWLAALLAGITLAMSMLPQEFLLILTVFMAMGAWRLSRERVLSRRSSAIETLGACTVLCTDKTGTLTRNRMQVAELLAARGGDVAHWTAGSVPMDGSLAALLRHAALASECDPLDPMERAIHELVAAQEGAAMASPSWQLVREYELTSELPAMTHGWQLPGQALRRVATKGAPEAVLGLCAMAPADAERWSTRAAQMAARGLRVLAVAEAERVGQDWPASPRGFDFRWLGLVGLADPLRPSVAEAVRECREAGIRVLMITGDHASTALAIAAQAGLDAGCGAVTGPELAAMDDAALRAIIGRTTVFARVRPEQKLRLVEALKAQGQVVAMTGDGVNDAPSLKAAHIGIAMGARGTDVAREAASLVLLDDDFGAMVHAVRLGRRIYDNLRKAMAFVLAVHVPIAGLSLLPLLMGWPLVFMPVHIAFLELLIDPVCSIAFEAEAEERDLMHRPPRDPAAPLLSYALMAGSLLQGSVVLMAVAGLHAALLHAGVSEGMSRATTFTALVLSDLALIVVNRSLAGSLWQALRQPNPALARIVAVTVALLAATLGWAPLRELFRFEAIDAPLIGAAAGVGLAVLLALQALKRTAPAWMGVALRLTGR